MTDKTHFGYEEVRAGEKARRVAGVFASVAPNYDLMNDLMSLGLHRAWKAFTVAVSGVRPGDRVLDLAGGSGDLARSFARRVGPLGEVWLTDVNRAMLEQAVVGQHLYADSPVAHAKHDPIDVAADEQRHPAPPRR